MNKAQIFTNQMNFAVQAYKTCKETTMSHTKTPYYTNGCYGIYAKHTKEELDNMERRTNGEFIPLLEKMIARVVSDCSISVEEKIANIEFIVKACNNHDALIEMLKLTMANYSSFKRKYGIVTDGVNENKAKQVLEDAK